MKAGILERAGLGSKWGASFLTAGISSGEKHMKNIADMVKGMLDSVPGLRAAIVIDSDGIPLAMEGDIDMEAEDLGAMLASAFQCYQALGDGLGQFYCELVTAEFDGINVAQQMMPRGSLILVAEKSSPMGVIRVAAKTGRQALTEAMETTAEARKRFMEEHKLRLPKLTNDGSKPKSISLLNFLEQKKKKG
jgi:predicted regulator of Ras-like GTPase activity (Roadblock/LC7/MglB family)